VLVTDSSRGAWLASPAVVLAEPSLVPGQELGTCVPDVSFVDLIRGLATNRALPTTLYTHVRNRGAYGVRSPLDR
jgi:hypothetical protein